MKTPWYHLNFGINANTLVTFNGVNRKLLLCFSQNLLRSEGQKRIPDAAHSQGAIKLKTEPIDLSYMLVQLSDELSPVLSAQGNSVVLEVDEDITVCADADQLARVFGNILKNAAAYGYPDTEIKISAEKTEEEVTIFFQNKGKTIPAERLPFLFDKFYRLDKSRTSDTGGTGLGLAIAKEIVLLHGGTIDASSENDTITFAVHLPATNSENIYPASRCSQETDN